MKTNNSDHRLRTALLCSVLGAAWAILPHPVNAAPAPEIAPGAAGDIRAKPRNLNPATPKAKRPADTRCRDEVASAFAAQRDHGLFKMKTRMIDQRGVVFMTVDYQLPSRMRQRVKMMTSPDATVTLLVAGRAWTKTGDNAPWQPLSDEQAGALSDEMATTVISPPKDPLDYKCTGKLEKDGQSLSSYEGVQKTPQGKIEPGSPIRIVHIDNETGLPVMNAVAPQGQPERPFFKATYTYPADLNILPPSAAN